MARRIWSLHHNLRDGENVIFHREHISPRNRHKKKLGKLQKYKRKSWRRVKSEIKRQFFM